MSNISSPTDLDSRRRLAEQAARQADLAAEDTKKKSGANSGQDRSSKSTKTTGFGRSMNLRRR